jgi:hypothetical protein
MRPRGRGWGDPDAGTDGGLAQVQALFAAPFATSYQPAR